jgi:hypothetical protein
MQQRCGQQQHAYTHTAGRGFSATGLYSGWQCVAQHNHTPQQLDNSRHPHRHTQAPIAKPCTGIYEVFSDICHPAAQELASCISELEAQKAPSAALSAVRRVLGDAVSSGVQQLVVHLQSVAPLLVAREGWQLSLTHSGDLPVTLLPEQLQVCADEMAGRGGGCSGCEGVWFGRVGR